MSDAVYADVRDRMRKKVAYRVCSLCGHDVSNRLSTGARAAK